MRDKADDPEAGYRIYREIKWVHVVASPGHNVLRTVYIFSPRG